MFVGIDVIGDYLTEINVTSPTGIQEIDRFDGGNLRGPDLGRDRGPEEERARPGARAMTITGTAR